MRLLLDTHLAIWAVVAPERIAAESRQMIADPSNISFVSAASIWEIGQKHALGRRTAPPFGAGDAIALFDEAGFELIDITAHDAAEATRLPRLHGDPFDRLLVAQALKRDLRLLTRDAQVARYSDTIILMR